MCMPRASTVPRSSNSTIPTANRRTTRLRTTTKTSTSTKKAATTQTATPASTTPQKRMQKASGSRGSSACLINTQSGRLASSVQKHDVDSQAEPDLLEAGKDDCRTPRRPFDQARLQLEPSNINQAKKAIANKEDHPRDGGRPQHLLTPRQHQQMQQRTSRAT